MQSVLQYRRFGRHVAAQYERDRSKAKALGASDASESTSPSPSNPNALSPAIGRDVIHPQDHGDVRDPEKGELSSSVKQPSRTGGHPALEIEAEKSREQDGAAFEPIRTTPSGRQSLSATEETDHMSRATTVPTRKSMGTALGITLTGIDVRDRNTKEGGEGKVFVVGYEGEKDIMDPHNWSLWTRFGATYA